MNKKNSSFNIIYFTLFLITFGAIGIYAGNILDKNNDFLLIVLLLSVYLIYLISIIIHEFGHMIFGLLSGYKLLSFRVFNFMIVNNNGKYQLKKMSLAGTAGQCLMFPKENNRKFVLYNMGGIILNIICFIISFILLFIVKNDMVKVLLFSFTAFNLFDAITNGIPFKATVNNDMQNILNYKKNPKNLEIFFNSLYIQNAINLGTRLKDIDKKYIYKPDNFDTEGEVITMVFYCEQLIDKNDFKKVIEETETIINNEKLNILYKSLLINDLIYCYIILDKNLDNILSMKNKDVDNVLKQMKSYPSVIRTNYTYSLLIDNNIEEANNYLNQFNIIKKSYPYPVEIESELELIELANNKYKKKDL